MAKKIITHEESDEDFILGSLMKGNRPELEQSKPTSKKIYNRQNEKYRYLKRFVQKTTILSRIAVLSSPSG